MEHLPPVGWADVATKQDIASLRAATKHDIASLRAATKQDVASLRAATKQDVASLRHELTELEARLDLRFEAALQRGLNQQTRTIVTWLIAGMGTSTAAAVAALVVAARGLS